MEPTTEDRRQVVGVNAATSSADLLHRRMDALERQVDSLPDRICLALMRQAMQREAQVDETLFLIRQRLESIETRVDRLSFGVSRVLEGKQALVASVDPTPTAAMGTARSTEGSTELTLAMRTLTTALLQTRNGLNLAPASTIPNSSQEYGTVLDELRRNQDERSRARPPLIESPPLGTAAAAPTATPVIASSQQQHAPSVRPVTHVPAPTRAPEPSAGNEPPPSQQPVITSTVSTTAPPPLPPADNPISGSNDRSLNALPPQPSAPETEEAPHALLPSAPSARAGDSLVSLPNQVSELAVPRLSDRALANGISQEDYQDLMAEMTTDDNDTATSSSTTTPGAAVAIYDDDQPVKKKRGPKKGWKKDKAARLLLERRSTAKPNGQTATSTRDVADPVNSVDSGPRAHIVRDGTLPETVSPEPPRDDRIPPWRQQVAASNDNANRDASLVPSPADAVVPVLPKRRGRPRKHDSSTTSRKDAPARPNTTTPLAGADDTPLAGGRPKRPLSEISSPPAQLHQQVNGSLDTTATEQRASDESNGPSDVAKKHKSADAVTGLVDGSAGDPKAATALGNPDLFEDILGPALSSSDIPSPLEGPGKGAPPGGSTTNPSHEGSLDRRKAQDARPRQVGRPKKKRGRPKGSKLSALDANYVGPATVKKIGAEGMATRSLKRQQPSNQATGNAIVAHRGVRDEVDLANSDTSEMDWHPTRRIQPDGSPPVADNSAIDADPETPRTTAGDALVTLAAGEEHGPTAHHPSNGQRPHGSSTPSLAHRPPPGDRTWTQSPHQTTRLGQHRPQPVRTIPETEPAMEPLTTSSGKPKKTRWVSPPTQVTNGAISSWESPAGPMASREHATAVDAVDHQLQLLPVSHGQSSVDLTGVHASMPKPSRWASPTSLGGLIAHHGGPLATPTFVPSSGNTSHSDHTIDQRTPWQPAASTPVATVAGHPNLAVLPVAVTESRPLSTNVAPPPRRPLSEPFYDSPVSTELGLFLWKDGESRRAPENWQCPTSTCKTMWCYWFRGDAVKQIGPFRFLRPSDVNDANARNLLGRGRTVMDHLTRIAMLNQFAGSLDHISEMAPSDFMGVFDKSFEIFLGKTGDGALSRDGFESIRWEQVLFTTYGAVYDLITSTRRK